MGQVIQAADLFKPEPDELTKALIDIARAPIEEFLVNPDEPPPEVA